MGKSILDDLQDYKFEIADADILSEDRFRYPDMGDFYLNAVDDPYFRKLQEAVAKVTKIDNVEENFFVLPSGIEDYDASKIENEIFTGNSPDALAFYSKGPSVSKTVPPMLGDYPEQGVILFKGQVDVSEEARKMGFFDGDTLAVDLDTIEAGTPETATYIRSRFYEELNKQSVVESDEDYERFREIQIRFMGINTPEVPHWSYFWYDYAEVQANPKEYEKKLSYAEAKQKGYKILEQNNRPADSEVKLFKVEGKWIEFISKEVVMVNNIEMLKVAVFEKSEEVEPGRAYDGVLLQKKIQALVTAAGGEVYFMIDKTSLNYNSQGGYPLVYEGISHYDDKKKTIAGAKYLFSQLKSYSQYKYSGFNQFGMDTYGRFLGEAFVILNGQWINLNKYMITQSDNVVVLPDYTNQPIFQNNGGASATAFNLNSYDFKNKRFSDINAAIREKMDDRRRVQQKIFGLNFDSMKDYNVILGDTVFFVPPTSIRTSSSSRFERLPIARGKGSMTKGGQKVERLLELTVYFNEEKGINGYPFKDKLPNGEEITYHMNGLRALIAQFKFTPYLPIENRYINEVLNIEAVTLRNIQLSTTPKFPKMYQATITLEAFDYLQYMPELPVDLDENSKYYNPFAGVFNFELMRWYYQQSILRGERLRGVSINDQKYLEEIQGSKTALLPMEFKDSKFKLYEANEDHLKKMMQIKVMRTRDGRRTTPSVTETEHQLIDDLLLAYEAATEPLLIPNVSDKVVALNKEISEVNENYRGLIKLGEDRSEWALGDHNKNILFMQVKNLATGTYYNDPDQKAGKAKKIADRIDDIIETIAINIMKMSTDSVKFHFEKAYIESKNKAMAKARGEKDVEKSTVLTLNFSTISENYSQSAMTNIIATAENMLKSQSFITKTLPDVYKNGGFTVELEIIAGEQTEDSKKFNSIIFTKDTTFEVKPFGDVGAAYMSALKTTSDTKDNDDYTNVNEEVDELSNDSELLETLTYDELDIGEVNVSQLQCVFGNSFTQMGFNGTSGFASQFMGGQDTIIEMTIHTMNEYAAGVLARLTERASYLVSNYKLVMPSAPILFESDITRLLGVKEVVVESSTVNTVPGQPGLYEISIRMVSVDRTMRAREGVKKMQEIANGGMTTIDGIADIKNRTFKQLNERLGEAELYPDLEIPTLKELEDAGFMFLRHTFDKTRKYPDPDFYFVYGHILQSEIFREAVIDSSNKEEEGEIAWVEPDGSEYKTKPKKGEGKEDVDLDEKAKTKEEASEKASSMVKKRDQSGGVEGKRDRTDIALDIIGSYNTSDVWELGEDIRVVTMEPHYRQSLINYSKDYVEDTESKEANKWIYDKAKPARDAIKQIDEIFKRGITGHKGKKKISKMMFYQTVANILHDNKDISDVLLTSFGYRPTEQTKFKETFADLIFAAACAKTGKREYRKGVDKKNWHPDLDFIGFSNKSGLDSSGDMPIKDLKDVYHASEFGMFRFKMYTRSQYLSINGKKAKVHEHKINPDDINTQLFLLDPYYANASLEEIQEYKEMVVQNSHFAIEAFIRICLVWLKRLLKAKILPNMSSFLMTNEFTQELTSIYSETSSEGEDDIARQIKDYMEFIEDSRDEFIRGHAFLLTSLAVGENELYKIVKDGNFEELNQIKTILTSTKSEFGYTTTEFASLRKFLYAMVGVGVLDKISDLSRKYQNQIQEERRSQLDRKYIEFSDDPNMFVRHAFYDMCVNDMRGRMARAFPSYYMVLIDEGVEIGMYKLNDNFYSVNAVSEINVHKSRKIPADTCHIVLSNMYSSYTTDDEDRTVEYTFDPMDIFNSVFRPGQIYEREQDKRLRQQPLNKVKLTAGTRLHVRMGYGANAATLPVAFNGRITEINAGDVMEVVAQGDGVELMNQFVDDIDAEEVQNEDKFWPSIHNMLLEAATPKEILDGVLNTKNSYFQDLLSRKTDNYFKNPNKRGILNFGDTKINPTFGNGEVVQNIFEGIGKPMWGDLEDGVDGNWNLKKAPKISMELMGKTFWDLLHFCASATPDFIGAVAPFNMRSTIFHGHPRFYYAFDYILDDNGNIAYEKRKPFSQYHIVTSYSDIISNNIKADNTRIKTNAVGTFKDETWYGGETHKTTNRLYVDWDIYPENQKSMVYDTQLFAKGAPMTISVVDHVYAGINFIAELFTEDDPRETSGYMQDAKLLARKMTANALKDSMRDMYAGTITMMGIPSLKPHDRLIINDTYENMSGHVTVEAHTLSFSGDTGLISVVTPDLISVVDDNYEIAARGIADNISTAAWALLVLSTAQSLAFKSVLSYEVMKRAVSINTKVLDLSSRLASKYKVKTQVGKVAKKAASFLGKTAIRAGAGLATASLPGLIGAIAWSVGEFAVVNTLGAVLTKRKKEQLLNGQVLTLFPLKHNGKVLTSGLAGEVGSVAGSANFNKKGFFENVATLFDGKSNATWLDTITNIVITDDMQEFADNYANRKYDYTGENGLDSNVGVELAVQDYLDDAAAKEANKLGGYQRLLASPRINIDSASESDAESLAQKYYREAIMIDANSIETNTRIASENVFIMNDSVLRDYADKEEFFQFIWDAESEEYKSETNKLGIGNGKYKDIVCFYKEGKNGKKIYDLPFLKDDAISVLKQIIVLAHNSVPVFDTGADEDDTMITITSALIVGEEQASLGGMGYSFTLQGTGTYGKDVVEYAILKLKDYNETLYAEGKSVNKDIFVYNELDRANGKYQVSVLPPK